MKAKESMQGKDSDEAAPASLARKIDREALVAAIETELPEVEHYLDLRTGEILTVVGYVQSDDAQTPGGVDSDNGGLALRILAEPDSYAAVPSIAPEAGFRWMQEFSATVADSSLREKLHGLLRDCTDDCFESFRGALLDMPEAERERWFAFRNEMMEEFINAWLEGVGAA